MAKEVVDQLWAARLAKAVGLDPNDVSDIALRRKRTGETIIEVEVYPTKEVGEILKTFGCFKLVPIEDGD